MRVVGGGSVIDRLAPDELPHVPESDEFWQESVVLFWWDANSRFGGFHRIGHEPNYRDGPIISLWNNIYTPEEIYKNTATLPLTPEDRLADGQRGGETCRFQFTDHAIWTIKTSGIDAVLHAHDCHTPVDIFPKKSDYVHDFAPNHMDVASKVSGQITFKGRTHQVDALGFRDHGWGHRDWKGIVSHRWVAMTFEDGTMGLMETFHSPSNQLVRFGCVIRNDELTYAKDVDVLTFIEPDGLTHRGGRVTTTLTTGEHLVFDCEPLEKGIVSWIHGIACVDTPCRVRCGDKAGIACFEATNNALRGSYRPYVAINGIERNGIHPISARPQL